MPSRIHCSACQAAFHYSPALLGRTVKCRQCSHTFTVAEPPPEEVPVAAAASATSPVPPPLPARRSSRTATAEVEPREPAERRSRRRPVHRDRPGGTAALLGLVAAFIVGFLVIAAGIGFVLWPSGSKSTAPSAQGPGPSPAVEVPLADEKPKPLKDILKDAPPPQDAGPAGGVSRPNINRPPNGNLPRRPGGPMPNVNPPAFPPAAPAQPAGQGPKFAPLVPLEIKPARMARDRDEISLPGSVETVAIAGGGRLLLLHIPKVKQVVVFDVSAAKVVKEIDAPDPDTMFAGGMNSFVIYQPGKNVIERWSCDKLERQSEVKSPFSDPVKGLAMGNASNGPLVAALAGSRRTIHGGATLAYYDPTAMREVSYVTDGDWNPFGIGDEKKPIAVRVSADGRLVTAWGPEFHSSAESNVLRGGGLTRYCDILVFFPLLPGPMGERLFGRGEVLGPDLKGGRFGPNDSPFHFVPAAHGGWYVAVRGPEFGFDDDRRALAVEVLQVGKKAPAATFATVDDVDLSRAEQGLDQSVILVPDAKVLITVAAPKRAKLVLRRVELK